MASTGNQTEALQGFTNDQIATLHTLLSDATDAEIHNSGTYPKDHAKELSPLFEMVCEEAERRKLWWAR